MFQLCSAQAHLHGLGVGEEVLVPGEVALAIGVLDVEPQDVVWKIKFLEFAMDLRDVFLVLVIPPALVVSKGKHWREVLRSH